MSRRKEEEGKMRVYTRKRRRRLKEVKMMMGFLLLLLLAIESSSVSELPPARQLPAETILLENGSTTFVSTLDDYLRTSTAGPEETTGSGSESAALRLPQLEREEPVNGSAELIRLRPADPQPEVANNILTTPPPTTTESNQNHHHNNHQHKHQPEQATTSNSTKPVPQHYQVKSLLNVTQDYPLAYSQIICGYVWPLMAAITLFTNLMIVFVLTQKDMRTPTNVVLTAIAIADIIPIVVPVPWFVYLFAMGNEKEILYPPVVCYFYQHSTRSVSEIFYFLSTWLNVLLAVQDYLTACRPNLAKRWCQIKVVVYEIIFLTLLAFLLNLPQALKLVFKPVKFYYNGQLTWGCRAMQAKWFKEFVGEYVALYDDIFTALIVVFVDGGPAIALITLSALLIRQLQRQRIQGHLLMEQARTASKRRMERNRQQEYESSARVMIFVLLAFLAVKIPFATTYTLMIIQSRFEIHFVESLVDFQKAISITDLVFVLSYPINFTIFCCCSKKFRHKCIQLFGEFNQNTKKARQSFMDSMSFSGSFQGSILSRLSNSSRRLSGAFGTTGSGSGTIKRGKDSSNQTPSKKISICELSRQKSDSRKSLETIADTAGSQNSCQTITEESQQQQQTSQTTTRSEHSIEERRSSAGQLPPGMGNPDFRSQLEDGTLCLECILQYEQMRRLSSLSASLRRQSTDSTSWPPAPPPPPPPPPPSTEPLSTGYLNQHLPHIITTRCESIVEQDSLDLETSAGDGMRENYLVDLESNTEMRSEEEEEKEPEVATLQSNNFRELDPKGNWQTGRNQPGGLQMSRSLTTCHNGQRGNSDPGTSSGILSGFRHNLTSLIRRASGNSSLEVDSGEANLEQPGGQQQPEMGGSKLELPESSLGKNGGILQDTQRQILSKSESKLTTLPNATGLLADVMISTLFGPGLGPNATGEQSKQPKKARKS